MRLRLGFHDRLAAFLVVLLVGVQGTSMYAAYRSGRAALVADAERQMERTADLLDRQLRLRSRELADKARILTLDFALREVLATGEPETMLSAMRNFGDRIGARRTLFVAVDGTVAADTGAGNGLRGRPIGLSGLLTEAVETGSAVAAVAMDGGVHQVVALPVNAPVTIGWIVLATAIDDPFTAELRDFLPLGGGLAVLAQSSDGWSVVGSSAAVDPVEALRGLGNGSEVRELGGASHLVRAVPLRTPEDSPAVVALLEYPLDAALRSVRSVLLQSLALLAVGAAVAVLGVVLIARGVGRPVEALAEAARRIGGGDYGGRVPVPGDRTIARLARAFNAMADAVSEREARIRHQATHDSRTGLPNRAGFEARLEEGGGEAPPGGLLLFGLPRLPEIKFTLGHELGDLFVGEVARRMVSAAPPAAVAGHVGDGAFAVFAPGLGRADAERLAAGMLRALEAPYRHGDVAVDVDAAVGIALAEERGARAADLLRRADLALFAARRDGLRVRAHEPALETLAPERLSLMGELRAALESDGLELAFQPKLDLRADRVTGVEALLRWTHPRLGRVPPDLFVTLAEETGNVHLLTAWVLRRAVAQAAAWRRDGLELSVAVNLSATDLGDAALPERVGALLAEAGLPASALILEVTETAAMRNVEAASAVLAGLAALGCPIAVDDFGSGQSSLAYLRRLPLRELKIDKSFVLRLASEEGDRAIVRAVIELGRRFGLRVTAEGVEDATSLDLLRRWGCDLAQGYHIARPMPAAAVPDAVRARAEAAPG